MAAPVVAAEAAGAVPDGVVAIEVAPDQHPQARTRTTPGLLLQLQGDMVGGDDVVPPDDPFVFHAEDLLEVDAAEADEGGRGMRRRPPELGIELGDEVFAQIPIGAGDGADAGHAQFIDEAALERAIGALTATRAGGE